ncbi:MULTISPECIES: hypothetical protein [Thioclava]|uniref:hypothetical protein n=1 Tax=Thioclava TaxID=285107 RepID=UPI000C6156C6|nr:MULTISPECIES: hypothetical protein [Thioclava]MAQ35816.1 hypothetical protein [Thioclava sp.]|tara:strand:- start:2087 stop:2296 length:210 start_codon:yes stop_codon:yes gene_type:complete
MRHASKAARIFREEDGAVTVDWVVLVSAVVSFGFIATILIWQQTAEVSGKIATFVDGQEVKTVFAEDEL